MTLQSYNELNVSKFKKELCFINMLNSSTSLFVIDVSVLGYSTTKILEYLGRICMFDYSGYPRVNSCTTLLYSSSEKFFTTLLYSSSETKLATLLFSSSDKVDTLNTSAHYSTLKIGSSSEK